MSAGRIGERLRRSDGAAKVTGSFDYASDLVADGMLHGATLRSPYPAALIRGIDTTAARSLVGVRAVLTADDLPGARRVGMIARDQPVLCDEEVRHHGDAVALIAADDAATARRARDLIAVDYEPIAPIVTVDDALAPGARVIHPEFGAGNIVRRVRIVHGDPGATGPVVIRGVYEVASQDQAFLGPEAGLAIPQGDGGVLLRVATQWLHGDLEQVAAGLGLPEARVRLELAGVGGAFGGREDLSMQLHACLLALHTGRPVRMSYLRDESFLGHVHRHPAWMEYEHHATADGVIVCVRARLRFDGGAYASSTSAVVLNAATVGGGPYEVPNALIDAVGAYTNNPPNGAMRGFGSVQVAIAYEAQMDRLADAVGIDPLEVRARNAMREGDVMPTGQVVRGPVAIPETVVELRALPDPPAAVALPGAAFDATRGEGVRRGVGYALGYKNTAFSEGFDDSATARVRLEATGDGGARCIVHTAASEVGQGVLGVQEQIARTELGVDDVRVAVADTDVGSAGSASASRLTWMIGGALRGACAELRSALLEAAAAQAGCPASDLDLGDGHVRRDREPLLAIADVLAHTGPLDAEHTYHHIATEPLHPETGQGDVHAGFAFCGHRAVVDVDIELGLARVVELTCVEDVGRAINPLALEGQLEGASIQGLGLALSEALVVSDGIVHSRSFGAYRIPTFVDAAPVPSVVLELADPNTPYGVKGVGELASISSTPAILAALRDATGREVTRAPARPEDLVAPVSVHDRIDALAALNDDPAAGGITREVFTPRYREATDLVAGWMREAGLEVSEDAFGNLLGRCAGDDPAAPAVMSGSHFDTTLNAGRYDGVVGVLGAIEVAAALRNEPLRRGLVVVGFAGEEPRFGSGCIGSRAMTGALSRSDLDTMTDRDGVSVAAAQRAYGLDPDRLADARLDPAAVHAFVELHIEQGAVLETAGAAIGVVTAIAAPHDLAITIAGKAAHAGSTPMGLRRDALTGAAEVALAVERIARESPSTTTVATVGVIHARPGAINVIAGEVELHVDVRDSDEAAREAAVAALLDQTQEICARRGLTATHAEIVRDTPAQCAPEVVAAAVDACAELGLEYREMISGAYHDALILAARVPVGMLFVPSRDGLSHHPDEYTDAADIDRGIAVLTRTLRTLTS